MQTPTREAAEIFTSLVRRRFADHPKKYKKYSNILCNICSKRGDPHYGLSELKKMFENHQDLLISLNNFLPKDYQMVDNRAPILDSHDELVESTIEFVNKVHKRFAKTNNRDDDDDDRFIKFCDVTSKFKNKQVTINAVDEKLSDLFQNDPELYVEFTRFMVDEFEEKDDDSECDSSVENCVFRSGYTRSRTKQEKTLMMWETYKYEMDIVYYRMRSTLVKLKSRLVVQQLDETEGVVNMEELRRQDYRVIKFVYGRDNEEKGEIMVQQLRTNPEVSVPVIRRRMEKKYREIENRKVVMDRIWGEVLEDFRHNRAVRHKDFLTEVEKEWSNKRISRR